MRAERGPPLPLPGARNGLPDARLRARIRMLRPSRLGEALAERSPPQKQDAPVPASREISPELVLVDPALAAWARERC